jgi:hypothetical protein
VGGEALFGMVDVGAYELDSHEPFQRSPDFADRPWSCLSTAARSTL